jgi:asparagine synthase (glutamine-hydrolysing)
MSLRTAGPDGAGMFVQGRIGLGHRRLSIVDPEAGQQPMASDDGADSDHLQW